MSTTWSMGLMRLMATPDEVTGPMNLGNPVEFTIGQLAKLVVALTGSSSKIVYRPLPHDDPKQRCPDISLAQQHLAWPPRGSCAKAWRRLLPISNSCCGSKARRLFPRKPPSKSALFYVGSYEITR
jgi:hypothetical protein